jgi:hypothetical protein
MNCAYAQTPDLESLYFDVTMHEPVYLSAQSFLKAIFMQNLYLFSSRSGRSIYLWSSVLTPDHLPNPSAWKLRYIQPISVCQLGWGPDLKRVWKGLKAAGFMPAF